jgi:hypothetical protein
MKRAIYFLLFMSLLSCNSTRSQNSNNKMIEQSSLTNATIKDHAFLNCMYNDSYFPVFLVDKCKNILLNLCQEIEIQKPNNLDDLYILTHKATDQINDLQDEFFENNSEIETGARECLAKDFEFVAKTYDYHADIEKLIVTREW